MSGWRLTADIEGLLSRARERRDGFRCHDATSRPPGAYLTKAYAPKCLEEEFCKLRLYGVLGSSCGPGLVPGVFPTSRIGAMFSEFRLEGVLGSLHHLATPKHHRRSLIWRIRGRAHHGILDRRKSWEKEYKLWWRAETTTRDCPQAVPSKKRPWRSSR